MRICKVTLQSSKTLVATCLNRRADASMTKTYPKSSNMRHDAAFSLCSNCGCQGLPVAPGIRIPVREKAPAMPPASSRCRGSRVGIFPSLCSTPSIQDVQSSQSSTMPAFEICTCASQFQFPEGAQTHSGRLSETCSCDKHCIWAQLAVAVLQTGSAA